MNNDPLPRLDGDSEIRETLLPHCRLGSGDVWTDPQQGHRVACLDAADGSQVAEFMGTESATLAIQDPPYNLVVFKQDAVDRYIAWCRGWVRATIASLSQDAAMYVWLGADQREHFQPLPDFMLMMREFPELRSRSFLTMRNQRGYGTQKNWMAVRQELLYYKRGEPPFEVQYTRIPKILRGYYKQVGGRSQDNLERGRSPWIRAGNVWVDVQQVFYRMDENVSGCYAQKPLPAVERIVRASSRPEDLVIDFFAHSGTTLLACERLGRRCRTADIDPLFCEITIRRLEHYRRTGRCGWQNGHAFQAELG